MCLYVCARVYQGVHGRSEDNLWESGRSGDQLRLILAANLPALHLLSCLLHLVALTSLLNSKRLLPVPTTSALHEHILGTQMPGSSVYAPKLIVDGLSGRENNTHRSTAVSHRAKCRTLHLHVMSSHPFPQRPHWRSWSQYTLPTSASWSPRVCLHGVPWLLLRWIRTHLFSIHPLWICSPCQP